MAASQQAAIQRFASAPPNGAARAAGTTFGAGNFPAGIIPRDAPAIIAEAALGHRRRRDWGRLPPPTPPIGAVENTRQGASVVGGGGEGAVSAARVSGANIADIADSADDLHWSWIVHGPPIHNRTASEPSVPLTLLPVPLHVPSRIREPGSSRLL